MRRRNSEAILAKNVQQWFHDKISPILCLLAG